MINCVFFGNLYLGNRVPFDFFEFTKDRCNLDMFGNTSGFPIPDHVAAFERVSYEEMRSRIDRYDFCLSLGNLCDLQIPSKIAELDQMGVKTVHIVFTPNDPILELPRLANFIYVDNRDLLAKPESVIDRIKSLIGAEQQPVACALLKKEYVVNQYVTGLTRLLE